MSSYQSMNSKRQKTNEPGADDDDTRNDSHDLLQLGGIESLRHWVSHQGCSPDIIPSLLSSQDIYAIHILQFVLEYVFDMYPSWPKREFSRDDRVKGLVFVTRWLAQDYPSAGTTSSKLPSLAVLCAQRIAMGLFHTFLADLDRQFKRNNVAFFTHTLTDNITTALEKNGIPEHLQESVKDELLIFAIVYLLYVDLRELTSEPYERTELQLPVPKGRRDECWWHNYGMHSLIEWLQILEEHHLPKRGYCHIQFSLTAQRAGIIQMRLA